MLAFLASALTFAISLTLGTDVVAKHGSKDKVLFGSQFIQRTCDEQTDGIETFLTTKIDVDILLASGLHHVVDGLAAQSIGGKSLETAVAGKQYHPAHTFLIFIDMVHQHLHGGGQCLTCHLPFYRLLHTSE